MTPQVTNPRRGRRSSRGAVDITRPLTHVVAGALVVASVLLAGLAVEAYADSQKDPGIPVPSEFHMTFENPKGNPQ